MEERPVGDQGLRKVAVEVAAEGSDPRFHGRAQGPTDQRHRARQTDQGGPNGVQHRDRQPEEEKSEKEGYELGRESHLGGGYSDRHLNVPEVSYLIRYIMQEAGNAAAQDIGQQLPE